MRPSRRRALVAAVAIAASWLALIAWAAQVHWRSPLFAANARIFHGAEFHAVFGSADPSGSHLHVATSDAEFSALQSVSPNGLDAADYSTLRYRFQDFPRTLELSLVFRTAQFPNDVQSIALPWPGAGVSSFDLSRIAGWRGSIIEIGFAEFATAQNVPPALGFRPFDIVGIKLTSRSWRGDLAVLATDWFSAWPWSQRSVHSLGREGQAPRSRSVVLIMALGIIIAVGWTAIVLGLRGRRLLLAALTCAAIGWVALDLRWQAGLVQRLIATRTLYAGTTWAQRERTVGDSDVVAAAQALKSRFLGADVPARTLIAANSRFQTLRLMWHLLPLNSAEMSQALPLGVALPEHCLIVFLDTPVWRTDPALIKLLADSERVMPAPDAGSEDFDANRLVVFRYHDAH